MHTTWSKLQQNLTNLFLALPLQHTRSASWGIQAPLSWLKKLRLSFQLPLRAGITAWISARNNFSCLVKIDEKRKECKIPKAVRKYEQSMDDHPIGGRQNKSWDNKPHDNSWSNVNVNVHGTPAPKNKNKKKQWHKQAAWNYLTRHAHLLAPIDGVRRKESHECHKKAHINLDIHLLNENLEVPGIGNIKELGKLIGSLSNSVFEGRTSTGSWLLHH